MQLKSKLLYIYKSWFVLIHAKLHSDAHLRIVYAGRLRNAGILGQIFIMPFWPDFDYLNFYPFLRVHGGFMGWGGGGWQRTRGHWMLFLGFLSCGLRLFDWVINLRYLHSWPSLAKIGVISRKEWSDCFELAFCLMLFDYITIRLATSVKCLLWQSAKYY